MTGFDPAQEKRIDPRSHTNDTKRIIRVISWIVLIFRRYREGNQANDCLSRREEFGTSATRAREST
ncbi:MAG TPA: hypothetical protein DC054_07975 [Blastocatellia bacterium]|nr:hypothetical protein [Blastocatellia bacterium]